MRGKNNKLSDKCTLTASLRAELIMILRILSWFFHLWNTTRKKKTQQKQSAAYLPCGLKIKFDREIFLIFKFI